MLTLRRNYSTSFCWVVATSKCRVRETKGGVSASEEFQAGVAVVFGLRTWARACGDWLGFCFLYSFQPPTPHPSEKKRNKFNKQTPA